MLRPMDTMARFGGDEFTFLFEDLEDEREVVAIAQRISDSAELPFRLSRTQQLSVGVDTNISVGADHQFPRRNDYEGYLGYSANLTPAFTISAIGRVGARDYHQNGRTDVSEILSLTATYRLTNWCSISAISSFAHNDSNQDVFDYDVANAGGVLALSMKF